ncbi:hypothetical protein RRG08_042752 [Elysia crispata]|uniref:Uncharacterized protein n=1 Tax=Elysia crispata TaxID=231223 RepID=A0AAE0XR29_9GAST|nr:hypothetical protein RRG08_042752 [Elysia crispata]
MSNPQGRTETVSIDRLKTAFVTQFGNSEENTPVICPREPSTTTTILGVPPTDQRGKHNNRPRAFTEEQVQQIVDHIRSFRGRQSHYALNDTRRLFLSRSSTSQRYTTCTASSFLIILAPMKLKSTGMSDL